MSQQNADGSNADESGSPEAMAAAFFSLLRAPVVSDEDRADFTTWLAASDANRAAWEKMQAVRRQNIWRRSRRRLAECGPRLGG